MKLLHVFSVFGTAEGFFDGQFKYLSDRGYDIIVASSDSERAEEFCRRNNVSFVPINIPRSVSPSAILKAVKALRQVIKVEKVEAVFGHTPVGALCAMMAAWLSGVRYRVYYRHGLIYTTMTGFKRFIFKNEERFVAWLATDIINVSHSLSRLAKKERLNSPQKQFVIGHGTCGGIDTQDVFNPVLIDKDKLSAIRTSLHLYDADIVYGFCGRLCNDKGINELVDGFELFLKRHPQMKSKLLLIGGFDTRDGISEEKKQQISNNENIVLSGKVEKSDIPYYYSLLDVFVFPSHREGFGMCVIEASAMAKPVLCSHAHGCEDAIVEHVTGEYIPLTPEGICKGMESMLDSDLRHLLGYEGRKSVVANYDKRVMWPQVADLYAKILGDTR